MQVQVTSGDPLTWVTRQDKIVCVEAGGGGQNLHSSSHPETSHRRVDLLKLEVGQGEGKYDEQTPQHNRNCEDVELGTRGVQLTSRLGKLVRNARFQLTRPMPQQLRSNLRPRGLAKPSNQRRSRREESAGDPWHNLRVCF